MGSDSFERGGRPRSASDPDREAYEEMIRRHRRTMAAREDAVRPSRSSHDGGLPEHPHVPQGPVDMIASSVARILNGPREARREVEQGHVIRGVVEGATSAADLEFGRSIVGGIRNGSFKLGGSHSWKQTRQWLGKKGLAAKGQHAHHALIPNGGWGKAIPDAIKNQPWNIKATETPLHHIRIHGRSRKFDLPQFNAVERYWHGTPTWWKAANGSAVGHVTHAIGDHFPGHSQHPPQSHPAPRK